MNWFSLSLLAPLCWGFSNVLDAALRRHFIQDDYVLTWGYSFFRWPVVLGLIALFGFEFPGQGVGWMMLSAGFLWTVMFVPYFQALEREETTRVALFLQTLSLFTLLLAYWMLDETLTSQQLFAFVLILIGGTLAGLKRLKGLWRFSSGFVLIVIACFFWALSDVWFKQYAVEFETFAGAYTIFLMGSALTCFLFMGSSRIRKGIQRDFGKLPLSGWAMLAVSLVVSMAGSMAFAYALTLGKVALTAVFTETQPLFVFFFSGLLAFFFPWVDKEDLSAHAVAIKATSLVVMGVGLFYLYF